MTRLPIGLALSRPSPSALVDAIADAEERGLGRAWSTVGGTGPDAVTAFAAAALRTRHIQLGTSIVPAYPRHPVALASQALVVADLAPGRFRLGIGPSHRPTIEGMFGIPMERPLVYMREYLTVLRQLLWEGRAEVRGDFLSVHAALPAGMTPPRVPLLLSALRPGAFRQAGEIADGAISWVCPIPYLLNDALPAMREGAASAGRDVPPLIAHVPVVVGEDRQAARTTGRAFLDRYARLPFYAGMFARAGYPTGSDGEVPDALVAELVVWGDAGQIVRSLEDILSRGIDELLLTVLPGPGQEQQERSLIRAIGAAQV
ncbi:MAG: LLM class flavin-dependent oxidoreductase [Chloroflexi bacterium]|nr:LLM class flavin-dependent oxidoreductase [Chloroflexota bacterium]